MLHRARSCIDLAHTSVVAACMSSGMNHPLHHVAAHQDELRAIEPTAAQPHAGEH
jgi:hypothetical protein